MGMTTCRGCGQPLLAGAVVCGVCGVRVYEDVSPPVAQGEVASTTTVPEGGGGAAEPLSHAVTAPAAPVAPPPAATVQPVTPVVAAVAPVAPVAAAPVAAATEAISPTPTAADQAQFVQATYDQIAARSQRNQTRRMVLVGVTALVLTLIARVAISAATHEPEPEGEIVAQLPVGPEGGSAEIEGGGKIKVPKGAVDRPQTITVRRTVVRDRIRAVSPFGGSIIIPAGAQTVYIFGPTSIVFLRPVTIVLPAPPPPAQGIVFISANGQITFIQGRAGNGTIVVRVNSFNFNQGQSVFVT